MVSEVVVHRRRFGHGPPAIWDTVDPCIEPRDERVVTPSRVGNEDVNGGPSKVHADRRRIICCRWDERYSAVV